MADFLVKSDVAVTLFLNKFPLTDDTDFKERETGVTSASGGVAPGG